MSDSVFESQQVGHMTISLAAVSFVRIDAPARFVANKIHNNYTSMVVYRLIWVMDAAARRTNIKLE